MRSDRPPGLRVVATASRRGDSDEAFHRVFAEMPPGWRFKGLYLASHAAHKRRVGWWYAQASGPDPERPGTQYGLTGEGKPGHVGIVESLHRLADQLENVKERFPQSDVVSR